MDHRTQGPPPVITRRQCLAGLAALSAGALPAPACGRGDEDGPLTAVPGDLDQPGVAPVTVPLASLPEAGRYEVAWGAIPVELRRTAGGVEARALLCTHQGCKVVWRDPSRVYECACHQGHFDESGRPVSGMPTRPLRRVPLLVSPATVYVGATPAA